MIPWKQALDLVIANTKTLATEMVPLSEAGGRVLAQDLIAPFDSPRFTQSAVDGYAVRFGDVNAYFPLQLIGEIKAGDKELPHVESGTCVRVFTGGAIPPGANAVAMQEIAKKEQAEGGHFFVNFSKTPKAGENIRKEGEEFRCGDKALSSGFPITPSVLALAASFGFAKLTVYKQPSITIIATGNELLQPGEELKPGHIYDSNSWFLKEALRQSGNLNVKVMHVRDESASHVEALNVAFSQSDCVLTIGGVSVGDYDWVARSAQEIGVKEIFHNVAIKPGKPLFFGSLGEKLIFGLPGNPVATALGFTLFVMSALRQLSGQIKVPPNFIFAYLAADVKKKAGRADWIRVQLNYSEKGILAKPVRGQESHMLGGLASANAFAEIQLEAEDVKAGTVVKVLLLSQP